MAFGILAHQFGGSTFLMTGCCAKEETLTPRTSARVEIAKLEELAFIFILIEGCVVCQRATTEKKKRRM
jgi:hypothetical protein